MSRKALKIVTIVGARPQFVKAATVSRALRDFPDVTELLVHTGQHYDGNMSTVFFDELDIPRPAYNLELGSGAHGAQTGRMIEAIETVLLKEAPGFVLVYGDTNSTLAGAVAAVKLHIPIAHVEAGLRSFNRRMPEEINRVLTDHAADVLFAPTETACRNLEKEGLAEKTVRTGDVMLDASLFYSARSTRSLEQFGLNAQDYCLATLHRAENTDDPLRLRNIMEALGALSQSLAVVLPLHPRTRSRLGGAFDSSALPNLRIIDPVGYLDMIQLEKNARFVATDSGGVQKEAYFFSVPCVTMRTETEWVELVENGFNYLAGTERDSMETGFAWALHVQPDWGVKLYGNGHAAQEIIGFLRERVSLSA